MRTNIDIDDTVMDAALRAGPYKTKKEAVEAGLKLVARQAAYREILRWEGRLPWDGDGPAEDDAAPIAATTVAPAAAPAAPPPASRATEAAPPAALQAAEPIPPPFSSLKKRRGHAGG